MLNPFSFGLSKATRAVDNNCARTWRTFKKYIDERVEARKKDPKSVEDFDLLNLMLDSEDGLFDEYAILSQISDVFIAAT